MFAALILLTACSQQTGINGGPGVHQSLPFDPSASSNDPAPSAYGPPAGVPAGTLIVIRLRSSISSATAQAGDVFSGLVDEPVVCLGHTLVPSGASVTGKVLDARASAGDPGYLRLVLTQVSIHGRALPLQTSSIFVKGNLEWGQPYDPQSAVVSARTSASTLVPAGARQVVRTGLAPASPIGKALVRHSIAHDVAFPVEHRLTFRLGAFLPV